MLLNLKARMSAIFDTYSDVDSIPLPHERLGWDVVPLAQEVGEKRLESPHSIGSPIGLASPPPPPPLGFYDPSSSSTIAPIESEPSPSKKLLVEATMKSPMITSSLCFLLSQVLENPRAATPLHTLSLGRDIPFQSYEGFEFQGEQSMPSHRFDTKLGVTIQNLS